MIPERLVRTVPPVTTAEVERWWGTAVRTHPDWSHVTLRDPLDPTHFPVTAPHWERCQSGAQRAGLIRLEAIYTLGGFYLDSDFEVYRPFDSLLGAAFVASGLSYIFAPVREGGVASRACECLTQRQAVPGARMRGVNACLGGRGQLPLARKDASTHVLDDMMRAGWLCECFMPNKDVQPPPPDPSYLLPT